MSEQQQATSFDANIVLRPRSLDETFDLAIAYLRTTLRDFVKLYAIFTIAITVFVVGVSVLLDLTIGQSFAISLILVPIYERIVTVFAGRHLFSNPASIGGAIGMVMKRFGFFFIHTGFIVLPTLMIALTDWDSDEAMGVIGIMLAMAWLMFVVPSHIYITEVLLLEQLPVGRAMRRARVLIAYRFGRALGSLVFSMVVRVGIVAMVYFGLNFLLGFVLQFEAIADNIGVYFAVFGYVLGAPYVALARLFDYVDARTRREGWDIQVRFNAIAQRAAREEARRLAA